MRHQQRAIPVTTIVIVVVYVIASIIQLVAGVMGIRISVKRTDALKSVLLFIISILAAIVNMAGAGFTFPVFSTLLGLVVPGLYIYGKAEQGLPANGIGCFLLY